MYVGTDSRLAMIGHCFTIKVGLVRRAQFSLAAPSRVVFTGVGIKSPDLGFPVPMRHSSFA